MGQDRVKKKSESLPSIFLKRNFDYFITLRCMKKKICKEVTMFLNPVQRGLYFSPGPASPLLFTVIWMNSAVNNSVSVKSFKVS